jgi:hypothetical protein
VRKSWLIAGMRTQALDCSTCSATLKRTTRNSVFLRRRTTSSASTIRRRRVTRCTRSDPMRDSDEFLSRRLRAHSRSGMSSSAARSGSA